MSENKEYTDTYDRLISEAIFHCKEGADAVVETLLNDRRRKDSWNLKTELYLCIQKLQSEIKPILKDSKVDFNGKTGKVKYNYASLPDIDQHLQGLMARYSLLKRFEFETGEGQLSVTCIVSHINGAEVRTTATGSPDITGGKNPLQAMGSAITYLERYSLLACLGVVTADADTDGLTSLPIKDEAQELINIPQMKTLENYLEQTKSNVSQFLDYFKVKRIDELTYDGYLKAHTMLKAKLDQMKQLTGQIE